MDEWLKKYIDKYDKFISEEKISYSSKVIPVNESIRWTDGNKNQQIDREKLRIIQTPQVFEAGLIKKAYQRVTSDEFTDDASVIEAMGEPIHLFEGNPENIKITFPYELLIAEALFALSIQTQPNSRPTQ